VIAIEVRTDHDPLGRPCVVLQLPDGWATLLPADALMIADQLITAAEELMDASF
jgi:hypothetical protein